MQLPTDSKPSPDWPRTFVLDLMLPRWRRKFHEYAPGVSINSCFLQSTPTIGIFRMVICEGVLLRNVDYRLAMLGIIVCAEGNSIVGEIEPSPLTRMLTAEYRRTLTRGCGGTTGMWKCYLYMGTWNITTWMFEFTITYELKVPFSDVLY